MSENTTNVETNENVENMTEDIDIFESIRKFNEDRNLLGNSDIKNGFAMITEEVVEGLAGFDSKEARVIAINIVEALIEEKIREVSEEEVADSLVDIIVYAIGELWKLNYNPRTALEEVLKQIHSRTGKVVNGKFEKDTSPEAQKKWYQADLSKAKIK